MRVAVVLDKSGTVVKAYRVLCDVKTGASFPCDSTLKYVAEKGETLVNVRGAIGSILKGDLRRLGLKVSCYPKGHDGEIPKGLLTQAGVIEALKRAIGMVEAECGRGLGICAALLVEPEGRVTHAVALGGEIYGDVWEAVAALRSAGDDVFLATGNCRQSSLKCARLLGIPKDFVLYDANQGEKMELVRKLRSYYGAVIMVGNDFNDLDAMREADLGVLLKRPDAPSGDNLGKGGEVDFVLDSLSGIVEIVRRVRKPLPHSTGPYTRGACGEEP